MTTLTVSFPGGQRVDAVCEGFVVSTDQPLDKGGDGTAPSPFDVFLASIATCAGFYVKRYCDTRGISISGLALEMHVDRNPATHRVQELELEIRVPEGFPEKHREGVLRAAQLCAVKKQIEHPPAFSVRVVSFFDSHAVVA